MLKINHFWDFERLIVDTLINIKTEKMALTVATVIHCRYVVFEKTFEDFPNILQGWSLQSSFGHTIDQVAIDSTMNTGYSCMYQDVFFYSKITCNVMYISTLWCLFCSKMSPIITSILIFVLGPFIQFWFRMPTVNWLFEKLNWALG